MHRSVSMCHHLPCAMDIVQYALCNWNVQSCVIVHCVLLCNHVSCTMCNWNVFVHSLLLHSTRNDLIKRLLLYYSFHLFLPFHLSICFFVFLFFIFHFTPFISTFVFTLWCISPVLIFTQFFTSMISAFFATTWNSLPTAHKAALSPFSISPDLPTEHCIIPEDNSQCTSGTFYVWF